MGSHVEEHDSAAESALAFHRYPCDSSALGSEPVRFRADAQERVRRRLAFDLHDGPVQSLLAALLQLHMLLDQLPPKLAEDADLLHETLSLALQEMYAVIEELRPTALEAAGLVDKIRRYIDQRTDEFGFEVSVDIEGQEPACSPSLELALFRVVQEALTNCRRHAAAGRVMVSIAFDEKGASCRVSDDGCGFVVKETGVDNVRRYGILGMRERVELLGGTFAVHSAQGTGTTVSAVIPTW